VECTRRLLNRSVSLLQQRFLTDGWPSKFIFGRSS
jgi:hypothetical protein